MVLHLCIVSYLFIPKRYNLGPTLGTADEVTGVLEADLPHSWTEPNVATFRTNAVFSVSSSKTFVFSVFVLYAYV